MLRNADKPAAQEIDEHFEKQNRSLSTFKSPYSVAFPEIPENMWEAMKNTKTAMFNKRYEDDIDGDGSIKAAYKDARLKIEFALGQPLSTFSPVERATLLDAFKDMLKEKDNVLHGNFEGQIVLSREHTPELAEAVAKAAQATDKDIRNVYLNRMGIDRSNGYNRQP